MKALLKRSEGGCKKRVNHVQGPNNLWHIDANYKLIQWNLVIVGGIDVFSRLPVMLKCTDNNKADTVLSCFMKAVN